MQNIVKTSLGISEIIGDKRAQILALAQEHGASNVRIFGSVARGEARPDSDIDFCVSFKTHSTIFDVIGLWQDLTELLQREVDLVTDSGLQPDFKAQIAQDIVPL